MYNDNGFWAYVIKNKIIRHPDFVNYHNTGSDRDVIRCYVCHALPRAGFMNECETCARKFKCASNRNEKVAE